MIIQHLPIDEKRTLINTALHNGEVVVEFVKVNGDLRSMPCTLAEGKLPPQPVHVTNTTNSIDFPKPRKVNLDTARVWCTDKQEWRSFRYDSVISIAEKGV